MLIPLTILAVLSVIGGFVGTPWYDAFGRFLEPLFPRISHEIHPTTEYLLMGVALLAGAGGIYLAYLVHLKKPEVADQMANVHPVTSKIHRILLRKYYVDEIYDAVFVRPINFLSDRVFYRGIDVNVIDGIVNDSGAALRGMGNIFRRLQTGDARAYAAAILIGTLGLIAYLVWMVK
jgi:NADH-quinone oxidoreductase subunit L